VRFRFGWLLPDLAMVAAAVTLFYCLFLFQGYRKLFRDSDAGWHIRNGETILSTGQLPRVDPYSFTKSGQPWFAWEWASDVAMGAVDREAGLRGVALFYGIAIAAGIWMWFHLHWAMGGNFLLACAMTPLLLSTCNIHWLARPHVLGWLLLLGVVWWCERRGALWVLAVLMVVWANVHASFFLGAVVVAAYELGARGEGRGVRGAASVAIALIAPVVNPYGWRLYEHVWRYLTDSDLLSRIGEFQSFDFHAAGAGQIIATLILGIAGGTLALTLRRYHHFALAMLFSVMALRSARALPLVALVLLPIANSAITSVLPFKRFRAYCDRLRAMDAGMNGWALAPLLILLAFRVMPAAGFPPDEFPVAAYDHVAPGGRLFASDKYGGYLIYRSNGARKVFFDGRSDFYGAEFLKQYGRMVQVRPGWKEYWNSFGFSQALLPNDAPLLQALQLIGWRPVYRDGTATLLASGGT
jgi:hypothetical protein